MRLRDYECPIVEYDKGAMATGRGVSGIRDDGQRGCGVCEEMRDCEGAMLRKHQEKWNPLGEINGGEGERDKRYRVDPFGEETELVEQV